MGEVVAKSTLEMLDRISRERPLTQLEALQLERAMRGQRILKGQKPWSAADILRLRANLLKGNKPAQIAVIIKRTERAVWRQMRLLGWSVRMAEQFSREKAEFEQKWQLWVVNPQEALSTARATRNALRVQSREDD